MKMPQSTSALGLEGGLEAAVVQGTLLSPEDPSTKELRSTPPLGFNEKGKEKRRVRILSLRKILTRSHCPRSIFQTTKVKFSESQIPTKGLKS